MTVSPGDSEGAGGRVVSEEEPGAAAPSASSASSGSRKEKVRPTAENLTLTNGREGPELMAASV